MLTGEWGCGKTHLIENELKNALKDTHIIVRISLFGVSSASALQETIRTKWIEACLPFLGLVQKAKDKGVFSVATTILKKISLVAGNAAGFVTSLDLMEAIRVRPTIENLKTHKKMKVVFVYDDPERAKMDPGELMGLINDYCENQHFNTIISSNEEAIREAMEKNLTNYQMLREKTISQLVYYIPDYHAVIHSIIDKKDWPTPDYAEYLADHEDLIREVFMPDLQEREGIYLAKDNRKYHNFRALTKGLQRFFRIYSHIKKSGNEIPDGHLYSFLAYYLAAKSGVRKDGKMYMTFDEEEIKQFYPRYSSDDLTDIEREWIADGIWDSDSFGKELKV